jgi:hypothetical protein
LASLEKLDSPRVIEVQGNIILVQVSAVPLGIGFPPPIEHCGAKAEQVGVLDRFDLDNLGAQVAEQHGRERAEQHLGQIKHSDSLQRTCHSSPPFVVGVVLWTRH